MYPRKAYLSEIVCAFWKTILILRMRSLLLPSSRWVLSREKTLGGYVQNAQVGQWPRRDKVRKGRYRQPPGSSRLTIAHQARQRARAEELNSHRKASKLVGQSVADLGADGQREYLISLNSSKLSPKCLDSIYFWICGGRKKES